MDWLDTVSKSDFFLCFSGVELPMCHNAIEAMAVGTIPIISYADWFFPALEHKKNAIVFKDEKDLVEKVNEVFQMPQEQIAEMRRNVLKYYETHLSAESFMKRYENLGHLNTIMLHPRLIMDVKANTKGQMLIDQIKQKIQRRDVMIPLEFMRKPEPEISLV
jgi:hypothetical protein